METVFIEDWFFYLSFCNHYNHYSSIICLYKIAISVVKQALINIPQRKGQCTTLNGLICYI